MSEPLSAERLAEIRARAEDEWYGSPAALRDIPDLLAEIDRLRAWQALSRLQSLAAEPGPSRWFSAANDTTRQSAGTDPTWDGIEP